MALAETAERVGRPSADAAVAATRSPARRRRPLSWRTLVAGVVLAFPFVFLGAFALYPLIQQAVGSFFRWYDLRPSTFAGLGDYSQALRDPVVPGAALHSVAYVSLTVPVELAIGLAGAWTTLHLRRYKAVFAAVLVLPLVVPWPAATELFLNLFANQGVVNEAVGRLTGGGGVTWLQDTHGAFLVIVLIGIWKGAPWCYLLLVGALMACPPDIFEAARVDGASGARFWLNIVVPSIRPMLVFVCIFRLLAEAQMLTSVDILTQGGPVNSTQLVSTYSQTLAFQYFEFGAACALGTLLGIVLLLIALAGWAASRPGTFDRFAFLARPVSSAVASFQRGWEGAAVRVWRPSGKEGEQFTRRTWSSPGLAPWRRGATVVLLGALALLPLAGSLPNGAEVPDTSLAWRAVEAPLWNSVLITLATLAGTLVLAVPAAYVLARSRSRWRGWLFAVVLFSLAIPGVVLLLPQFQEVAWLGLIDTRAGLVLLYIAANLPLAVLFLRPAFAAVPEALVESMRVDGVSALGVVRRLLLPLSTSTFIAITVFVVVQVWGEVPLAVTILNSPSRFPLALFLALNFGGTGAIAIGWLSIAPPLALFLVSQ
ncbi:MAG TPA: ABC transporter permease subunit, partial [Acidimicrobiales bacterium]|nr:ABC transporter permease subunit [Acidimicrobiales bacterium]